MLGPRSNILNCRLLSQCRGVVRGSKKRYSLYVDPISAITQRKVDFKEDKVLGYAIEDVFDIVGDVDSYKLFLPWCQESHYTKRGPMRSIAKLCIGFPPLLESYTALVLTQRPHSIQSISTDGRIFSHLENKWAFQQGSLVNGKPTTKVHVAVKFEFRSVVTARLGSLVFDEVARTMAGAFDMRFQELLGPSHLNLSSNPGCHVNRTCSPATPSST